MAFDVSEELIAATEAEIGRRLPAELRSQLAANNGGYVPDHAGREWQLHPVRDDTDRKRLGRTANDILRETKSAKKWTGFPDDAYAVGADGMGNLLVMLPGSQSLHAWDHETGQISHVVLDWSQRN